MLQDKSATYSDSTAFNGDERPVTAARPSGAHGHGILHRHHRHDFRGYTLEEIRLHKVINDLKISAARDRMTMLVSPGMKGEASTVSNCINRFDILMRYVDIAMVAYAVTRRISAFFRRFSRK